MLELIQQCIVPAAFVYVVWMYASDNFDLEQDELRKTKEWNGAELDENQLLTEAENDASKNY